VSGRLDAALSELAAAIREEVSCAAASAPPAPDRLLDVGQVSDLLGGVSRSFIYSAFAHGDLKSVKIGKRRCVRASAVEQFIRDAATGGDRMVAPARRGARP
jgi:excisionase family DNA binding protein